MKNTLFRACVIALLLTPIATASQAETYTLDPMHTTVNWSINHFGFSNPSGKFSQVEGTLVLDEAKPENSKVNVTIAINNLVTAQVQGVLTLHGVSKPVLLEVKLNKIGDNMMKKKTAGFSATTTLHRSDFGMSAYLPGLGDEVKIGIESEANIAVSP